ncbi:MAG TPA: hypothetical protein PKD55_25300, partial [Bellilinea sp.]|nr:hypothetical protein [Bellilinea sp.]
MLIVPLTLLWRKKRSPYYILCFSIFSLYLLFAMQQVFFPIEINGDYAGYMRQEAAFRSSINLIPFYFGPFGTLESGLRTMVLNVILT